MPAALQPEVFAAPSFDEQNLSAEQFLLHTFNSPALEELRERSVGDTKCVAHYIKAIVGGIARRSHLVASVAEMDPQTRGRANRNLKRIEEWAMRTLKDEVELTKAELDKVQRKLRKEKAELAAVGSAFRKHANIEISGFAKYPEIPNPIIPAYLTWNALPDRPGVYFVWKNDLVEYVGQASNLANRCNPGHERLEAWDYVSWLEFEREDLNFAEAFYMGICRPCRNRQAARNGGKE